MFILLSQFEEEYFNNMLLNYFTYIFVTCGAIIESTLYQEYNMEIANIVDQHLRFYSQLKKINVKIIGMG